MPISTTLRSRGPAGLRAGRPGAARRSICIVCITWATISPVASWRVKPIWPVAQNTHPIAQPAWLLMQAVTRPVKRISTVSMRRPSLSASRYLRVKPSPLRVSRTTGGKASVSSASSRARSRAGTSAMSAKWAAPPW